MKHSFLFYLLISMSLAQVPSGYYDSANGLDGQDLRGALHLIIDNHSSQSYSSLWTHFQSTDKKSNNKVWDMYSDVPGGTPPYEYTFGSDQCGNYGGEGDCYNREHSWPKSWFNNGSPMNTDLFHLVPTDGYVNGMRSNYAFGEVSSATWTSQNGSKRGSMNSYGFSGTVFEPIDAYKGDFARNYFYMSTRYYTDDSGWDNNDMVNGADLKDWAVEMLLDWHEADPVSQKELNRNNAIYNIQNNRNPFIDHPEWANCIWSECGTSGQNIFPVANAGVNQSVLFGSTVILNGSESYDVDGSIVSYNWEQTSGEPVTLSTYNGEYSSFTAPEIATTLSFNLIVTDNEGASSGDTVNIYISEILARDLFFSEYGEGSGENRYLEIFNPSNESVDLSLYAFPSVGNSPITIGEYEYWNDFPTNAIIEAYSIYIIAHPNANQSILSHADMTHQYLSNGNDGYALVKGIESNYSIIDWLGDWNGDPGDGWNVAGILNGTLDHTLVRKSSTLLGNLSWEVSAGTTTENSEWIVYNQDTWINLGSHEFDDESENTPPVAHAGSDQSVGENEIVELDGTGSSDNENSDLTFIWTSSPEITLNNTTSETPVFTSPLVEYRTDYLFTLLVSDGDLTSIPDTVIITVNNTLDNENEIAPSTFQLFNPYPNPFNPLTTIRYSTKATNATSLYIYDINGRIVETLVDEISRSGLREIQWNATEHPSGIYFVRLESGRDSQIQKLILLK